MPRSLLELKAEADDRKKEGRLKDALKIYRLILEGVPLDFELRMQIADLLAEIAEPKIAAAVYQSIAQHDVRAGNPLRAMVAAKKLEALGFEADHYVERIAARYASGAEALGRGVRPAPVDYNVPVRDDIDLDYEIDEQELVVGTAQRAAFVDNIKNYPQVVPPVSLFSALEREAFVRLLDSLVLQRYEPGRVIIEEGTRGDSIYFLARGEVNIYKSADKVDGTRGQVRLASLGAGSLFGEMALVSDEPRGASVVAASPVDMLVLARVEIVGLSEQLPQVAEVMKRFTQERMISNLLATNPLFEPFDDAAKQTLLKRFKLHEVPAGTVFLEEGDAGRGLFVMLRGSAEVIKWDNGNYVKLATLGPGSSVGEISLLHEEPVSATVRTTAPSSLLFLARELFKPLVDAMPDLLAHFARLAQSRLDDTELKITRNREETIELNPDEFELIDSIEEDRATITIAEDEIVFI